MNHGLLSLFTIIFTFACISAADKLTHSSDRILSSYYPYSIDKLPIQKSAIEVHDKYKEEITRFRMQFRKQKDKAITQSQGQ